MREAHDPIRAIERSRHRALGLGFVCCLALSAWAFWPMHPAASRSTLAANAIPSPPSTVAWTPPRLAGADGFDPKHFEARLWKAPPKPVEVVAAAPAPPLQPPPALKLQLMGIITNPASTDDRKLQAVFFDPETAKIYRASRGEPVLRYRVASVTPEQVDLADEQHSVRHILRMKSGELKPATNIRVVQSHAPNVPGTRGDR
ncbi:MAG: hypothetical protein J0L78_07195 [Planctomycetes bacterium]|nr:hypothetical protein [Planctomycetota bacterium]